MRIPDHGRSIGHNARRASLARAMADASATHQHEGRAVAAVTLADDRQIGHSPRERASMRRATDLSATQAHEAS